MTIYKYKCYCKKWSSQHVTKQCFSLSNDSLKFKVPRTITKAGEKGFHYAGPMIWNGLPNSIKTASSIISFKRLLKTFYFKIAYNL